MSAEVKAEDEFEIAHILFIDAVGYSKLLIGAQRQLLDDLNRIVREANCFRAAEESGKLIRLPTGDGMALVFTEDPQAPLRCALEISRAARDHRQMPLRMGIHSGPVSRVVDVNDRVNIAGAGINTAQRVMNCGDAGHILLSRRAAEDLVEYQHWRPSLHELGECEVKHGTKLSLVNLYTEEFGNPELPSKFKLEIEKRATEARRLRAVYKRKLILGAAAFTLLFLALACFAFFYRSPSRLMHGVNEVVIPEKSIAVLPFLNLSDDKQNAYFTDGVQDEILTALSRVADLKVISRTSVMRYKTNAERNLREIARALGVAHVLEGAVQRAGGRVRVNVQLIDARADKHLWAEHYDRELADVFAIQSELAEKIVGQLKAKLSPQEKAAIQEHPTTDLAAFDLYVRAKTLIENAVVNAPQKESLFEAVELLNQALERDPAFALAQYQLAHAHDQLYFVGADHTPQRLAMADAAIQSLIRLRPNSGEAHLAIAKHLYWGYLDYDRAREELSLAGQTLPNDPLPFLLAGYIDRRQSRWAESTKNLERAGVLDPRNPGVLQQIAKSYECLRRYGDAEAALDRALALIPRDAATRVLRAQLELHWHADVRPAISTIEGIVREDPRAAGSLAEFWLEAALCGSDREGARRALAALPIDGCHVETIPFPRFWCEGLVAQMQGDTMAARAAFTSARDETASLVSEQPNYAEALCVLGMVDAALDRKEDAIREGRRAVELLPVKKDAITGALLVQYLAVIYARTGEKDLAFEQLAIAANLPGYLSYGQLHLHPYWDALRADPRFEKILASLAPK